MALEIQGRRRRDKISLGNPADAGLIAGCREIPFSLERECMVADAVTVEPVSAQIPW